MDTIRNGEFQLANTNKLLRSYNGITGLKTGSTSIAKYCLSATAERDGMEICAAILAAPTSAERFSDAASLLNYGFANYAMFTPEYNFDTVPVTLGLKSSVKLKLSESAKILIAKGDSENIKSEVTLCDSVHAPVSVNQKLGSLKISKNNEIIKEIPIVSAEQVRKVTVFDVFWNLLSQCLMK